MKRVLLTVVGVLVVVGVLCLPALVTSNGSVSANTEDTSITDYRAAYTLDSDGDLSVTETIDLDVPVYGKHGIFRFWDVRDPSNSHARLIPHVVSITRDGHSEPYAMSTEDHGRFRVAKIGDKDVDLTPGDHVYVLRYDIDGVIDANRSSITGSGGPSMFYWNLVPGGWQQTIAKSTLTVALPVAAQQDVKCTIGQGSADGGCTVQGGGTKDLTVTTGEIPARTPVTIATALDLPTPSPGREVPWSLRWDRVLGQHLFLAVLIGLLALGALVVGALLGAQSREKAPRFPLQYAPPEGIGPAQAKYVYGEDIDNTTYVATLMYAAEHGAVDLARDGDTWTIKDKGGPQGWQGLDPVTTSTAHILGGPGSAFTASKKDVQAGQRLKTEIASFESGTRAWGRSSGMLVTSGLGGFGRMLVLIAFALVLVSVIWNPLGVSMAGAIPGFFGVGGLSLAATGSGTKRTRAGRDLWSRVGGFRRMLATPSSKARFDFAAKKELYTAYLPWAVALGCADQWAQKYRTEVGAEPPLPHYFAGYYGGMATASYVDSMVDSFNTTVSSAISSYNATQSSSGGGGGGGFSGGGGGGGGGGGSW